MRTLFEYLMGLNTSDNSWGLYVNPDNYDDYRVGPTHFENGGKKDGKVFVSYLSSVCFEQSESEAFDHVASEILADYCRRKKIIPNYESYLYEDYPVAVLKKFKKEIYSVMNEWKKQEVSGFLDTLNDLIEERKRIEEIDLLLKDD